MTLSRTISLLTLCLIVAIPAGAQPPAPPPPEPPPPPLWDVQVGGSFVGTTGNSDTGSFGADFSAHRRGAIWQIESTATAVRTRTQDELTAERYIGQVRALRSLTPIIGLSMGEKLERDQFAGIDFRSILDGGLSWALVKRPQWTLDGITGIAWLHESRTVPPNIDDPVGNFQLLSRVPFGTAGDTTQRFTYYPDFKTAAAYRTEFEVTAQAAMAAHLALKLAYLVRYANDPVPGFKNTDTTTTMSVVLRWKADTPAPPR